MSNELKKKGILLMYSYEGTKTYVDVYFQDETFWLTQAGMAELFDCAKSNISMHLKTIFALLFLAFVLYTIAVSIPSMIIMLIVFGVLTAVLLPTLITYIVVFNSYQTIEKHVIKPFQSQTEKEEKERIEKEKEESLTVEELLPLSKGDPEEYVFLNGKTLKRKTILKMIEVRQNKE